MKIEPDTFDVLVVGTGLVESIVAAAAAVRGKTVLQVDPSDYYGGLWATVACDDIEAWAKARGREVHTFDALCKSSGKRFQFDLSPKVVYADGPLISLLLESGAHNYTEFTSAKVMVWSSEHRSFVPIAGSRAEIFRDSSLTLKQKHLLMKAVKDVTSCEHGLERNFVTLLKSRYACDDDLIDRLLHGVLLQHSSNPDMTLLDASRLLKLYGRSSGKYGKSTSPFLLPIYGSGEMPQAFCRTAAVNGALQCLRCGVSEVEQEDSGEFAIVLTNGQTIRTKSMVASPDLVPCLAPKTKAISTIFSCFAIVKGKLFGEDRQCLAAYPRSASSDRVIWILQRDSSSGCCPEGYSCLQIWCEADNEDCSATPMTVLKDVLLAHLDCSSIFNQVHPPATAKLEFACFVAHDCTNSEPSSWKGLAFCADFSQDMTYLNIKDETVRCFQIVCQGEPFPFDEPQTFSAYEDAGTFEGAIQSMLFENEETKD